MPQLHHQRSAAGAATRRCEGTSMGSVTLDLRPGLGIGPFTLGMPIREAFERVEQDPNTYDNVHVKYNDEDPLKLDIVINFPDHGFHLRFDPWSQLGEELWFTIGGQHIPFGASPQDLWTELGRPCAIHQKQVDQMVIHSTSDVRPRTTHCGDYFYNYYSRGLDILFDGQTHRVKKFVLHTNIPGHSDFNFYTKCNFVIYDTSVDGTIQAGSSSKCCITPDTKWEQVKEILGDGGRAAIQTQGSMNNPFGSTFVYGYRNIALEVMKNGYIASITLFQT